MALTHSTFKELFDVIADQTGTLNLDAEIAEQENLITQIQAALQNKFGE